MVHRVTQLHLLLTGSVQGVAFRYWIKKLAMNLGLVGFVRNLSDGRVEIVAQGATSTLESLLEIIQTEGGPPAAGIDLTEIEWGDLTTEYLGFEIRS